MNGRSVTESTRERETVKYDPSLLTDIIYNEDGRPLPNTDLRTSHDPVLTSIASLGASRLKTSASIISLFDQKWQYIVAEATPTISLTPRLKHEERDGEQLWLCGTAIPRSDGVCEHTLVSQNPNDFEHVSELEDLPLSLVSDLGVDRRHCQKPYCLPGSPARFYAAVPIRSKKNINIGVYCVLSNEPRTEWNDSCTKVMRDLSRTIMSYLELRRIKQEYRRSERMTRGLGSFLEGKATTTGWRSGLDDYPAGEGALNMTQQTIQRHRDDEANQAAIRRASSPESPPEARNTGQSGNRLGAQDSALCSLTYTPATDQGRTSRSSMTTCDDQQTVNDIFSKAANIIRESTEIEGALFLDARMKSFGGLNRQLGTEGLNEWHTPSLPSDSDEAKSGESSAEGADPHCNILGFSTSDSSSIDGAKSVARHANVPEKLLLSLLRRYPRGKIFKFDEHGTLEFSDSASGSDHEPSHALSGPMQSPRFHGRHNKKFWSRQEDGAAVSKIFPGARSVAFVPVWDAVRDRWYAGCLTFTKLLTRIFTNEGELIYLRAFGMLAMAETVRLEATLANKAKSDVLSSLSHELRSPLHGVLLSVELLHDTPLDVMQEDVLQTLESCGRTLLDTVDHLLDFAKINNYMASENNRKQIRGVRNHRSTSIEDGMKNLYSDLRLDVLAEEVMESVFAGFNFQYLSVAQLARRDRGHTDREFNQRLDSMQAMEELGAGHIPLRHKNLSIYLDVDPAFSWTFSVTPGAIRRILMNLFGNALKYTSQGTISVLLTQVPAKKVRAKQRMVKIVVADTGKGISEDFLRNELFKPFSQEDTISPGTGLGLSLVKQIVSTLSGQISIQSGIGVGTTISVTLPLSQVVSASPSNDAVAADEDKVFEANVQQLRGLRIRLDGFNRYTAQNDYSKKHGDLDHIAVMERICQDWLGMQVVTEVHGQENMDPDLVLCTESSLGSLELNRPPTVVVCANALVAYDRVTSAKGLENSGIYEFVSQPTGPRKLANIILHAFKRWIDAQATPPASNKTRPVLDLQQCSADAIPIRLRRTKSYGTPDSRPSLTRVAEESELPSAKPFSQVMDTDHIVCISPVQVECPKVATVTATSSSESPAQDSPQPNDEAEFLIVDDNPINLGILSSYMKRLKRKYMTAADGQEAVNIFRKDPSRYRCVFMDISMPIMDGFEATRQMRALELEQQREPTSIFALSGLASAEAQQEAFSSGINLFLTKPVKLKELSSILMMRGLL